jgi:hypothetical protein
MNARDRVLRQAARVIAAWERRRTMPLEFVAEMVDLKTEIEDMNTQSHAGQTDPETSRQGPSEVQP